MQYRFIDLSTATVLPLDGAPVGVLGLGLSSAELADLTDRGYPGVGFWPVVDLDDPPYDALTERLGDRVYTVDAGIRQVVGMHPVVARTIDQVRTDLKARAEAKRYHVETGGVTIVGTFVKSDRESQALLTGAAAALGAGLPGPIDWKAVGVWVQLDAAAVNALATAVAGHVQACFSRERALCQAIDDAEDLAALAAIDIEAGWPA